ncbi:hypothetical protein N7520_001207 [Penicillium odoratum]|uniref:uncharacterized protein n=1 Tax=Penicillium odoratum TaxID=1167516 RepID=UPI0025493304|nr:uncharacterized protein N7520_001207 [Penicillium odoratum]KAJ5777961.1 hypothetical protein N7520_001207 [Penicillium odoratum]
MANNAVAKHPGVCDPERQPLLAGNSKDAVVKDLDAGDLETQHIPAGHAKFKRLGWKRLTVIAIVEAIALGSLGLPSAFAALGMVAGVILTVVIGLGAMYAGYIVGQVKLMYPEVAHYADVGPLIMGRWGSKIFIGSFVSLLVCAIGSHTLTGAIALRTITQSDMCSVIFSVLAAVIMMLLAVPPSFAEIAILGYIDFASIVLAIGVTMVATGIQSSGSSDWSAWPKSDTSFISAINACNIIVFSYSYAGCLPSFMEDMHTPKDYTKAMWWLGGVQIVIYTLTGSIIYAFVGQSVQSPALLSAGPLLSRITFGIALPVIFISGSINTTVVCRYIYGKVYQKEPEGWGSWLSLVLSITGIAWAIAEAIPIFSSLLSIISALFISGLSFYLPPVMFYMLLMKGAWYEKHNLKPVLYNAMVFVVGMVIFFCGGYASIADLVYKFQSGSIGTPFTCSA